MKVKDGVLYDVGDWDIEDGTFSKWNGITKIAAEAFSCLYTIEYIEIPDNITYIGEEAFFGCENLKEVKLSKKIKTISESMFENCYSLKNIIIPKRVKEIQSKAFKECVGLQNVVLSSKLQTIGEEAFSNCDNLEFIDLPFSLTSIGKGAFSYCSNIEEVIIPPLIKELSDDIFSYCEKLNNVILNDNLEVIGDSAFLFCNNLENINLNENIRVIGDHAFQGCSNLKDIYLNDNVEQIGISAFYNCMSLESIIIPPKITTIERCTFMNCIILENIKLPPNLHTIEEGAFSSTSIEKIDIPNTVKTIKIKAFYNCKYLKEVKLPNNLESIGEECFSYCGSLKQIELNNNLQIYGNRVFDNSLSKLIYKNNTYNIEDYTSKFLKPFNTTNAIKVLTRLDDNNIPSVIKFPLSFLAKLDKEQLNNIFKKENIKHFKDIYNKYIDESNYYEKFYIFAYAIGCFNGNIDKIDTNTVNIAQKASVFLKQMLDCKYIEIEDANVIFRNLIVTKPNISLLKFVSLKEKENGIVDYHNFKYLIGKDEETCRIINDFSLIEKQIVLNDNGIAIENPSIRRKIERYLVNDRFKDIKQGNEDIAEEFYKFKKIDQKIFNEAQDIREKAKNTPRHILNEKLEEETIFKAIQKAKEQIDLSVVESYQLINKLIEKEFTYEWLDKHDAKNFTLGLYCDCCATITSTLYGKKIVEDCIIRDDVQNLIIKDSVGEIIAKATIYVNKEKGYAVFNDIEMHRTYGNEINELEESDDEKRIKIYKAFKRGANDFIKKYNEIYKDKPITQVNIGWGYNRLKQTIRKFEEKSDVILEAIDSFQDSNKEQWIIYKK